MEKIQVGSVVEVQVQEGHVLFNYFLQVDSIDETFTDEDGRFACVAYGTGVTVEDKKLAEEFTSRIDNQNFVKVVEPNPSRHISNVLKGEEFSVVVGGTRFVIDREDAPRFPRGHGGNPFIFKMKDTGKLIFSTNVWNVGGTDQQDTAEILEYNEWSSAGVSQFGALLPESSAYVYSQNA